MRVYSKFLSFWCTHKLHIGVAGLVVLLHAGLLYALWLAHGDSLPATEPVFADVIVEEPPVPARVAAAANVPRREPVKMSSLSRHRATHTPVIATNLQHAPAPMPAESVAPGLASQTTSGTPNTQQVAFPVASITSDVSLTCPVRPAPVYPLSARKLGEAGKVRLRVELDETGRMVASEVAQSSGFVRLDEAAIAAVKNWRCQPAVRDGQPLRIVSMESFEFNLDD